MDNSVINVTDTNMNISIETGGFRVYGNMPSTLGENEFLSKTDIVLYPNPSYSNFMLNVDAVEIDLYSVTGQLIKTYRNVVANNQCDISDVNQGVYIVKIKDAYNLEKTFKLIKQ